MRPRKNLNHAFDIAMMVLSLVSVCVVAAYFIVPEGETKRLLYLIDNGICGIFISYFMIQLIRSDNRKEYLRTHWIDIIASIPIVEQLRFARILQIIRVVRMLRMANEIIVPLLKQRTQTTLAAAVVLLVMVMTVCAFLILIIEEGAPGSNIKDAEDAIWWSLITISTVGYGDFYPVTTVGRFISALLIICGVSLFGLISGLFASSLMSPKQEEMQEELEEEVSNELSGDIDLQTDKIQQILAQYHQQSMNEITALRQEVASLRAQLPNKE